jgi:DNA-directed RNA polymerase alpha subunit
LKDLKFEKPNTSMLRKKPEVSFEGDNVNVEGSTPTYNKFTVSPLERGYGVTL